MSDLQTAVERVRRFYEEKRGELPTPREAMAFVKEEAHELVGGDVNVPREPAPSSADGTSTMNDVKEGRVDELKEIVDCIWTLLGLAIAQGYNVSEAFRRLAASNMTKEPLGPAPEGGPVGEMPPVRKIQKGALYVEPYLRDLV